MAEAEASAGDKTTVLAFSAMVLGIGGNVVAVKLITREGDLDPLWAAASRFILATAIFAAVAVLTRSRFPQGRALLGAVLYGCLTFGAFFGLVYWGLQESPAGVAGVLLATGPLLTFLLAIAHGIERFRWDGLIGAGIVVLGTALVFSSGFEGEVPTSSLLAILAAAACAAEGSIVVKSFPPVNPATRNAVGMAVGSVVLLGLMPFFSESFSMPTSTTTWWAQVYLVIGGTVAVFGLYLYVLERWTASATSYEFVAAPIVGVALAAWLLDEEVTTGFVAGAALILLGVYIGAIRREAGSDPSPNRSLEPAP